MTTWAHLPNSKHIDWVLASAMEHPEIWEEAWNTTREMRSYTTYSIKWHAMRTIIREISTKEAAYRAEWGYLWDEMGGPVMCATRDAILALIAHDECGYMIESEVGELKLLAKFGDPRAIMLLPACIVFNKSKEIV